jgi:hypothetical protein
VSASPCGIRIGGRGLDERAHRSQHRIDRAQIRAGALQLRGRDTAELIRCPEAGETLALQQGIELEHRVREDLVDVDRARLGRGSVDDQRGQGRQATRRGERREQRGLVEDVRSRSKRHRSAELELRLPAARQAGGEERRVPALRVTREGRSVLDIVAAARQLDPVLAGEPSKSRDGAQASATPVVPCAVPLAPAI